VKEAAVADEYNLQRFIEAQATVYKDVLGILRGGRMCTPCMPFIFPRLAGSLDDPGAYAIGSLDEAYAYLTDRQLGARYRECVRILSFWAEQPARAMVGERDAHRLHASLTLFAEASNGEPLIRIMLDVWFRERLDEQTIVRLDAGKAQFRLQQAGELS
jgi:uncharacterized protein (DUF1810 family)